MLDEVLVYTAMYSRARGVAKRILPPTARVLLSLQSTVVTRVECGCKLDTKSQQQIHSTDVASLPPHA